MKEVNNSNVNEQEAESNEYTNDLSQVITEEIMVYIHIYLNTLARNIIAVVGVVTNLINMIIFYKLGLKDSISVGLFSLSLTDFLVTSIQMASCICYIIGFLCPDISIETRFIDFYFIGWTYSTFYEISCWITAMVSLERCCCVVFPFRVKQVFTRRRCIIIALTIYAIHMGIHIPVYTINRLSWVEIITPLGNNTTIGTPEITFKMNINEAVTIVELILDLTAGVFTWLISQAVVIVCAIMMGYSLEASSKVRHNASTESKCTTRGLLTVHSKKSMLSNRERRLVKVVIFLAIALTFCNVPKLIAMTMYYPFLEGKIHKQNNLNILLWTLASTFESLGCSITFVVYLKLNTSYRRHLIQSLCTQ